MFKFVTSILEVLQPPAYDLAPYTSFVLKSFGLLFDLFTSSEVVFITRVPSTTHWNNPEVVFRDKQLLVHWLGKMGGILPSAISEDP